MEIPRQGFLLHVLGDTLEAVFFTSSPHVCSAATPGNCCTKAGGPGNQSRALGQKTWPETPNSTRCLLGNPGQVASPL